MTGGSVPVRTDRSSPKTSRSGAKALPRGLQLCRDVSDIEAQAVADRVRFVFGDVAEKILRIEEQKLGIHPPTPLKPEDVQRLARELRDLAARLAGEELSKRLYEEILTLASSGAGPHPAETRHSEKGPKGGSA